MSDKLARISKKTAADAFAELAKEIPGVGAALAFVGGLFRGRTELKFQTFLEEVGKPLSLGDWREVVDYVIENVEHSWVVDGLEEGWRVLQETLDPVAKRCSYLMIADYLAKKQAPDRFHKQIGSFFQTADSNMLKIALAIADVGPSRGRNFVGWIYDTRHDLWVVCRNNPRQNVLGPQHVNPECVYGCDTALKRAGLASEWTGANLRGLDDELDRLRDFENPLLRTAVDRHQVLIWERLRPYLEPARTEPFTDLPADVPY